MMTAVQNVCFQIIHRRLAARNVLVKQQVNGLVAKLIGFGPTAEDADNNSAGTGAGVSIPFVTHLLL